MNIKQTSLKPESNNFNLNTGLSDKYRENMSDTLSGLLASSYSLTIKSQVYHWNVVGPLFKPIHELTEHHYNDLFAAIDIIAERIRALGHLTPMHQRLMSNMITTGKAGGEITPAAMIQDLVSSHEAIVRQMRDATGKAGEACDVVTEDMLTERLNFHEQAIWMLRSILVS